jgi:dTDP-4-dehydrorhamnose reductase
MILGGDGMLGHKLLQTLEPRFDGVVCTVRESLQNPFYRGIPLFNEDNTIDEVDVTDLDGLAELIVDIKPEVVVNCVGVIKQRPDAKDPVACIAVNSLLPHLLAEWCLDWRGRVIHFSTDCVFSGRRGGYHEDDESDATDLYGRTKFLGEISGKNALTLRTSIIGRELKHFQSLLEWYLAACGKTVQGYTRAIYSGVTTPHLAGLVAEIIENHPRLTGLYHVASQPISKHDLLAVLRDAYNLDVTIEPDDNFVCDRSFSGDKLREAIGYQCPPWRELAAELAADTTAYDRWRKA